MTRDLPRHHVSSSTVVYAIRYGMGRMTYADQDARDLVRAHALNQGTLTDHGAADWRVQTATPRWENP